MCHTVHFNVIVHTHSKMTLWIFSVICFRKAIFDAPPEDPNYQPLPEEDRPGGFNWGEGQRVGAEQEHEHEHEHEDWPLNYNENRGVSSECHKTKGQQTQGKMLSGQEAGN